MNPISATPSGGYNHPGALLPYTRCHSGVRHRSPRRDPRFAAALQAAPVLIVAPTFRSIGDSLFILAFIEAFAAYRTLNQDLTARVLLPASTRELLSHLHVPSGVMLDWFDDRHLYSDGLHSDHRGAMLVTDGRYHIPPGAEAYRIDTTHAYPPRYLEHDPITATTRVHASLTTRYALWFEELVGVVLPLDPARAHPHLVFPTKPSLLEEPANDLNVAVVATASSPAKDYGTTRYLNALAAALRETHTAATAHIILPRGTTVDLTPKAPARVRVVSHADLPLADAAALLAWSDLIIGNDTGITELAAISYRSAATVDQPYDGPAILAVFGRYDHDMWSISPRIRPVPSAASTVMTLHNRAHVLTSEEWDRWGNDADASSVHPARLAQAVRLALPRTAAMAWSHNTSRQLLDTVAQLRRVQPPSLTTSPAPPCEHAALPDLVTALFAVNASNWALEDQVRENYHDLTEVGRLKLVIDQHNRIRHQLIELIDDRILSALPINDASQLSLETPGMLIDRLTVLAIRLWHFGAAPTEPQNARRQPFAEQHWHDLASGLQQLLDNLAAGKAGLRPYRALKSYGATISEPVATSDAQRDDRGQAGRDGRRP